jgi:hypothetical protein
MRPGFMQSWKVWWSYTWRTFLLIVSALGILSIPIGLMFLGLYHYLGGQPIYLTPLTALVILLFLSLIAGAIFYLGLIINSYVINHLPKVAFRDFEVVLMKGKQRASAFDKFDSLCVWWSQGWRGLVIQVLAVPVITGVVLLLAPIIQMVHALGIGFLLALVMPLSFVVYVSASLTMYMLPIHWMLTRKRTGRYLILEKKTSEGP